LEKSIVSIINKTDLVIMSCNCLEQLLVAEKYADRAEDFMLFKFGSGLTAEEVVIYDEFRSNNKQKIAAKKIMLKS
tara:strand:+ start:708 stop:935 length:228 start_codon:yes stop_codon:yes gene_type:complete